MYNYFCHVFLLKYPILEKKENNRSCVIAKIWHGLIFFGCISVQNNVVSCFIKEKTEGDLATTFYWKENSVEK